MTTAVAVRSYSPITGADAARRGDEDVRPLLPDDLGGRQLVVGVDERPQEAHRQRLDSGRAKLADGGANRVVIERDDHVAREIQALIDLADVLARDDRRRVPASAVMTGGVAYTGPGTHRPLDKQRIAGAPGRDKARGLAFTLDEGVRGGRCPVGEVVHRGGEFWHRHAVGVGRRLEPVEHAKASVFRCRRQLEQPHLRLVVDHHHVGERSADVGADGEGARCHTHLHISVRYCDGNPASLRVTARNDRAICRSTLRIAVP